MKAFALDCSIAITWLLDDEATPETKAFQDRLKDARALVPRLRHWNSATSWHRRNAARASVTRRFCTLQTRGQRGSNS